MPDTTDGPARVRFGIFDFDPATRELRREGVPVRLQAQPAQVLGLLLQNAGEIVPRDTLRVAVWGTETFVDFDRGLNFCIAQIRSALGDSAEAPRFIRTVPKRGYQFVAPVSGGIPEPGEAPATAGPPVKRWRMYGGAAAVMLAILAVWSWSYLHAKPAVRVAVARFDNETGNAALDRFAEGLTDSIVAELTGSGSGRYEVIGNAAILREPRSKRDLIAIASSLRAGYVVLGQVQQDSTGRTRVLSHLIAIPEQTHLLVVRSELSAGQGLQAQLQTAREVASQFSGPVGDGRRRRLVSPASTASH